jgi:hypothetical protein
MIKIRVRKIKLGVRKNETGINTVLTIMPPNYLLFQAWHKGNIFFTLGFIQMVARRQYKTLCVI